MNPLELPFRNERADINEGILNGNGRSGQIRDLLIDVDAAINRNEAPDLYGIRENVHHLEGSRHRLATGAKNLFRKAKRWVLYTTLTGVAAAALAASTAYFALSSPTKAAEPAETPPITSPVKTERPIFDISAVVDDQQYSLREMPRDKTPKHYIAEVRKVFGGAVNYTIANDALIGNDGLLRLMLKAKQYDTNAGRIGYDYSPEQYAQMLEAIDKDNNRTITNEEVKNGLKIIEKQGGLEELSRGE